MTKDIKITVTAPVECTEEQFQEWVEYCTGYTSSIYNSNPLCDYDMEADNIDIH